MTIKREVIRKQFLVVAAKIGPFYIKHGHMIDLEIAGKL